MVEKPELTEGISADGFRGAVTQAVGHRGCLQPAREFMAGMFKERVIMFAEKEKQL
jgi:hypothetical protein